MSVGNIHFSVITLTGVTAAPAAASRQATTTIAPTSTSTAGADLASLSAAAVLLSGLQYQLTTSRPTDFKSLLEGAARSIYSAAQQQDTREQSKVLENIADRLQFAANIAGLAHRTPLSLASFLE